ncbi:Shedu anti-phage system protein SduA domain-containing protein [Chloroflexota bacterium]
MPEIKRRQINPCPEIDYAEFHIPDDRDLGTGSFINVTKRGVLSSDNKFASIMINPPVFQISVNFNPSTQEITVLLGFADGAGPISRNIYFFPESVNVSVSHEFEVKFEKWEITGLSMDTVPLETKENLGLGISTEGLLPPGSPIPEHVGTLIYNVPAPNFPKEMRDRILDDIFDLTKYFTIYQTKQGNTEIHIYRNTDFQFVYRHYNPTFGEREIKISFAEVERQGAQGFHIAATWEATKNSFYVGLHHTNPEFAVIKEAFKLSEDKLSLIRENIEEFEAIVNTDGEEEEAHQFLKNNSIILGLTSAIEPISKFKLGDDYVTDFVINEIPDGFIFVEIERPGIRLFKIGKENRPPERTQDFNHAIEQIENWRA